LYQYEDDWGQEEPGWVEVASFSAGNWQEKTINLQFSYICDPTNLGRVQYHVKARLKSYSYHNWLWSGPRLRMNIDLFYLHFEDWNYVDSDVYFNFQNSLGNENDYYLYFKAGTASTFTSKLYIDGSLKFSFSDTPSSSRFIFG